MPRTDEEEWELQHHTSYVFKPARPALPPWEGSLKHASTTPPPLPGRSESWRLRHATVPQPEPEPEPETRAPVPQPEPEPEVPAAEQSMGGAPPPPPRRDTREEETRLRLRKEPLARAWGTHEGYLEKKGCVSPACACAYAFGGKE